MDTYFDLTNYVMTIATQCKKSNRYLTHPSGHLYVQSWTTHFVLDQIKPIIQT